MDHNKYHLPYASKCYKYYLIEYNAQAHDVNPGAIIDLTDLQMNCLILTVLCKTVLKFGHIMTICGLIYLCDP